MAVDIAELLQLSVDERLEIVERVWESLASSGQTIPVPDWHLEELDRREEMQQRNPVAMLSWEEVKQRLREHHD
ncbi:MAG: addiction module protein [Thermoguttaceae bacterium]|jgi:putative addiction module component (TIGR02574 family)|nr:addiction module protein [Thermoguttaceae bacterium]